jgi:hypothetical protein
MNQYQHVEILLVEDSAADAEMTLRTLKKRGIANDIEWVRDGIEALEFLRCEGPWAQRRTGQPRLVLCARAASCSRSACFLTSGASAAEGSFRSAHGASASR